MPASRSLGDVGVGRGKEEAQTGTGQPREATASLPAHAASLRSPPCSLFPVHFASLMIDGAGGERLLSAGPQRYPIIHGKQLIA